MSQHHKFPNLFTPMNINGKTIKNRTIMGSMHTGLEEEKGGREKLAKFYQLRSKGGAGLIVTGGVAPNIHGWLAPFACRLSSKRHIKDHTVITDSVHKEGGLIAMQILHAGRYGYHPLSVAPSRIKAPITPFTPWALTKRGIRKTIKDFANSAMLAKLAGYDGVEIMGSEGYLINQFITEKTNRRKDEWGGAYENRIRFPLEIIRRTRELVGDDFIIIYRLSMLDLIEEGSTWDEIVYLAKEVEKAGASIINTGIGWHEARVPTIATIVPRSGFSWVTAKIKKEISIPCITSNRINTPEQAEEIIANGQADFVSMARPFLADENIVKKAYEGNESNINVCIACNQACLDNVFKQKRATCMVNPYACYETEIVLTPAVKIKNVAVVGAGPGGLAAATTLAKRGHNVTLFDKAHEVGGQFNIAKKIPGKSEFQSTLNYFKSELDKHGVHLKLNKEVVEEDIINSTFDEVLIATGVKPRIPDIKGIEHEMVVSYIDVISGKVKVGLNVAIIGAGGIGFDCAEFMLDHSEDFYEDWGIDLSLKSRGGITDVSNVIPKRNLYLLQRKREKLGKSLGKTTGWIHRASLKKYGVQMVAGVSYERIDDDGIHIRINDETKITNLPVTHVVICAGQEPMRELYDKLNQKIKCHLVGGADVAKELDAVRAIRQGTNVALSI